MTAGRRQQHQALPVPHVVEDLVGDCRGVAGPHVLGDVLVAQGGPAPDRHLVNMMRLPAHRLLLLRLWDIRVVEADVSALVVDDGEYERRDGILVLDPAGQVGQRRPGRDGPVDPGVADVVELDPRRGRHDSACHRRRLAHQLPEVLRDALHHGLGSTLLLEFLGGRPHAQLVLVLALLAVVADVEHHGGEGTPCVVQLSES